MKILVLPLVLILFSCNKEVAKFPIATGGSKADGTVTMSYEYGLFEKPNVDWEFSEDGAKDRCKSWNYKNAEKFGGSNYLCKAMNGYGNCLRYQVDTVYQCTNKK